MKNELVSIIVPIYNTKKYLKDSLDAIKNQTYKNIEVILVDDGSTDGSSEICDKFVKEDNRFKVFHNINHGLPYSRNFAVKKATGKYVMFCDSDDLYDVTIVEKMYNHIKNNNVDLVRCSYQSDIYTDHVEDLADKVVTVDEKLISRFLTIKNNIPCYLWILIMKKEIIEDIDVSLSFLEDTSFMLKMLMNAKTMYFTDEKLYYYRTNMDSITKNPKNVLKNVKSAYSCFKSIDDLLISKKLLSDKLKFEKNTDLIQLVFLKINMIDNKYYCQNKNEILKVLNDEYFRCALKDSSYKDLMPQAKIFRFFAKHKMYGMFFKYNSFKKCVKKIIKK